MRKAVGLLLLALALAACGSADAQGPPDISYGRDVCDECHMTIDDPGSAAAYRVGGDTSIFDDIGGLLIHGQKAGELGDADVWVHDYETEEWIEAASAWYVHGGDVSTPMAFGIAALSDEQRALDFAAEVGGEVTRWEDLVEMASNDAIRSRGPEDDAGMLGGDGQHVDDMSHTTESTVEHPGYGEEQ